MKVERLGYLLGRILFGFAAMTASFAAMRWINIIEINLLFNLQPLLVAVIAPLILGVTERPDSRTFVALLAALVGSSVIIAPEIAGSWSFDENTRWFGLCLGAIGALCGALAHLSPWTPRDASHCLPVVSICAGLALIPFDGLSLRGQPSITLRLGFVGGGLSIRRLLC